MARKPLTRHHGRVQSWATKGLARVNLPPSKGIEARQVEVVGAYPGEDVEVLLGSRRNSWLFSVLNPIPARIEPRCPHFGFCGGCQSQSLLYAAQMELKAGPVHAYLRSLEPDLGELVCQGSPRRWFYRSKVEYSFQDNQAGELVLGFNRRGRFDQVLQVDRCFIAPPLGGELLAATREWARHHGLSGWNARGLVGSLRFLLHRRSHTSGEWLAVMVTGPEVTPQAMADWVERVRGLGPTGLLWAVQSSTASAVSPESEHLLWGQDRYRETLLGLTFKLGWRSFFQSNPAAYQSLLELARSWISLRAGQTVLDLYCGVGTIGLTLTPPECRLGGVEAVEAAVVDARENALANGRLRDSAAFHCALAQDWPELACDLLVLDPPRSGCHPKLIGRLRHEGPKRILYISCSPHRLREELDQLKASYRLVKARTFDFFPHTSHLETLALLERREVSCV